MYDIIVNIARFDYHILWFLNGKDIPMRIDRLAQNKILVTLTSDDLNGLHVNIHTLHDDKGVLNRFLVHVMEAIREETDFNPYSGQIVVEAKSFDEGMLITVSKLGEELTKITKHDLKKAKHIKATVKKKPNRTEAFYFECFDNVCEALRRIDVGMLENCALYKLEGTYCMLLCCDKFNKDNKNEYFRCICVLSEYSSRTSAFSMQYSHIEEHGTLVSANKDLISMAEGIKSLYN